jgi:hypothetical protein
LFLKNKNKAEGVCPSAHKTHEIMSRRVNEFLNRGWQNNFLVGEIMHSIAPKGFPLVSWVFQSKLPTPSMQGFIRGENFSLLLFLRVHPLFRYGDPIRGLPILS